MATMRQIAAAAGVSAKTVSRVFNDDPHVLPATRERVESIMRELDYVPNSLATAFRSGRPSVIGVAVPDIVDPFFAEIARAVERAARDHDMSTLVTSLGDDRDRERATERFVRLEKSRSRPGSGLGLSLAKAVMKFHQGRLELSHGNPGLVVLMAFPDARSAA